MGYRYRSRAILDEAEAPPPRDEIVLPESQELAGLPGTRIPHLWLERQGQRISTVDLLDGRFVLLTGADGAPWHEAAAPAAASLSVGLAAYRVGPDSDLLDPEYGWSHGMGVSPEGAVLVRPDGLVAWRTGTRAGTPVAVLEQVLAHVLCRSAPPSS